MRSTGLAAKFTSGSGSDMNCLLFLTEKLHVNPALPSRNLASAPLTKRSRTGSRYPR